MGLRYPTLIDVPCMELVKLQHTSLNYLKLQRMLQVGLDTKISQSAHHLGCLARLPQTFVKIRFFSSSRAAIKAPKINAREETNCPIIGLSNYLVVIYTCRIFCEVFAGWTSGVDWKRNGGLDVHMAK